MDASPKTEKAHSSSRKLLGLGNQELRKFSKHLLYSTLVGTRNSTTLLASFSFTLVSVEEEEVKNSQRAFAENYNNINFHMRGTTALSPAKYKFKQIYPLAGSWGKVATSTPRKSENNDSTRGSSVSDGQNEPIAAFSRPPPHPPLLGPLVALSLLETWSHRDGDDN